MIAKEVNINKYFNYTNSVYELDKKVNSVKRNNYKKEGKGRRTQCKASTGVKVAMLGAICFNGSVNETIGTIHYPETNMYNFFEKDEYIPKTHGFRDCIVDTDYYEIEKINDKVLEKMKENKVFRKNAIDGLVVVAWDGVELKETGKGIENLPEREHNADNIKKYIKFECAMNIGEKVNILIYEKQMTETEKVRTKKGKEKAKTFGETIAFKEMLPKVEKKIGRIDVNVFDGLYLNKNIMNQIAKSSSYFVIRLKEERRLIYKDSEGIFQREKPIMEYEEVEITEEIKREYSKTAKKKDEEKVKKKVITRAITEGKLGERKKVGIKVSHKKNSIVTTKTSEKILRKIRAWSNNFEYPEYIEGKVRVVKTEETYIHEGKECKQVVRIVTNMFGHKIETIVKIMHRRWKIENNGFRHLKQKYKINHIFIGNQNAINYMFQIIKLVSNLMEVYLKMRLKGKISETYILLKKIFEKQIQSTKDMWKYLCNSP